MYNLDMIIAVGYRVNSKKETNFRIWATKILKEYMTKGFALNDERFINGNKYDVIIAKNYLNEEEMNNLKDLITATDDLLKFRRKEILNNSGSISHKEAVEKAEKEYEKSRVSYTRSKIHFFNG